MAPQTLLLVEDDPRLSRAVAVGLSTRGYRVLTAGSCQQAVALATQEPVELVVLDILLPDGTGWDFLRTFRDQPQRQGVPVVVITATRVSRTQAATWGLAACLPKPFSMSTLADAVARALAGTTGSRPTA
ncbi:MAG: response regulator [Chloroflexi bacterium]|nr:response regulator [Chloroflexota bacterium]